MIKIRLMRIGGRQRPFYRVVAMNERSKRTGGYLELLGTYDPLTTPHDVKLKQDRIDHWIKQGAKPTNGYLRMIGKAPQRPPRKPKKEQKTAAPSQEAPAEKPAEPSDQKEKVKTEQSAPAEAVNKEGVEEPTKSAEAEKTEETPVSTPESEEVAAEVSEEKK